MSAMWIRLGFTLGLSVIMSGCGGGSSSGSDTSSSGTASNLSPASPSLENVALTVDFPVDGSMSTEGVIAFAGHVNGLSDSAGVEIRVTSDLGVSQSLLVGSFWAVGAIPLNASTSASYLVELLIDGVSIASEVVELGFDQGFFPFSTGDALVLNEDEHIAYLLDDEKIIEINLLTGDRALAIDIYESSGLIPRELVWLSSASALFFVDDSESLYRLTQSEAGWTLPVPIEFIAAEATVSSSDGAQLLVLNSDNNHSENHRLEIYNSELVLVDQIPIPATVAVEKMVYLDADSILLFGGNKLVVLNRADDTTTVLTTEDLNLGNIDTVVADSSEQHAYVRSASTNELWQLKFDLTQAPTYESTQIDLDGIVSYAMAFSESQGSLVFSTINRVSSFDPISETVSEISTLGWGAGADWLAPASLAMSESGEEAYVSDLSTDDIYQVDMTTGLRVALNTSGESMEAVTGMVQDGRQLYSVDWVRKSVLTTDVDTGLTSELLVDGVGQPSLSEPIAIDLDADQFRAFILDRGLRAIYEVDTSSGNATLIADTQESSALTLAKDLSLDQSKQAIYWSSWMDNSLHRLNLNNLQVELISGRSRGAGDDFGRPGSVSLNADASVAYVSDTLSGKIFEVEIESGERRVVLDSHLISRPEAIVYDRGRGVLNILDAGTGGLYSLHPESGSLTLISM